MHWFAEGFCLKPFFFSDKLPLRRNYLWCILRSYFVNKDAANTSFILRCSGRGRSSQRAAAGCLSTHNEADAKMNWSAYRHNQQTVSSDPSETACHVFNCTEGSEKINSNHSVTPHPLFPLLNFKSSLWASAVGWPVPSPQGNRSTSRWFQMGFTHIKTALKSSDSITWSSQEVFKFWKFCWSTAGLTRRFL